MYKNWYNQKYNRKVDAVLWKQICNPKLLIYDNSIFAPFGNVYEVSRFKTSEIQRL